MTDATNRKRKSIRQHNRKRNTSDYMQKYGQIPLSYDSGILLCYFMQCRQTPLNAARMHFNFSRMFSWLSIKNAIQRDLNANYDG